MHRTLRLTGVAALVAGGLLAATAPAHAIVDPVGALECLTASAGEVTTLVDPSAPGLPAEVPAVNCLTAP
ncbi:hypothetical protein ACBI99_31390 [Nonomuraea sp. ATR24]|uniref:hypothetical protein n=1 Tax=Nonomuraea TaxID=83681 RepID=UPI001C5E2446|nr:hypothetical protein [Nonomuraea ceibae]